MVLGNSMSVLLKLEVDLSELSKLQQARAMVNAFSNDAASSFDRASVGMRGAGRAAAAASDKFRMAGRSALVTGLNMNELSAASVMAGESMDEAGDKGSRSMLRLGAVTSAVTKRVQGLTVSTLALRVAFLNMMFAGMNAIFLFGSILALSPRVRIGLMSIVNALRPIAMIAGKKVGPALRNLAKAIRNLSDKQKKLIADLAIVGTAFGAVIAVIGVLGGVMTTLLQILSVVLPSLGTMKTVLTFVWRGAMLALGGVRALAAGIVARLVPAISSLAAAIGVSTTALTGGLVVAIGIAIAAFLEFESVRKKAANGISGFGKTVANTMDFVAFVTETAANGFKKFGLVAEKATLQVASAMANFLIDTARKSVQAINTLIETINSLPDPKGLIPNLEKVEFNAGALTEGLGNVESRIDSINSKIANLESKSRESFEQFRRNVKRNKKNAEKFNKTLKDLFKVNKDLKIGDPLKLLNPLTGPGDNVLNSGTLLGQLFGGAGTMQQMKDLGGEAGGVTQSRRVGGKKVEKLQTINNEVVIRDATIKDERDLDQLARKLEEKMERAQKRDKTLI